VSVETEVHSAVVALMAPGARLARVRPFRSSPTPFPAALSLEYEDGGLECVVKTATEPGRLDREAHILRLLADLRFPAPRVLAGPELVPTSAGLIEVLVLSLVPGEALLWIDVTDVATADRTCRILLDAVDRLHALTPDVTAHPGAADVPTRTLDAELAAVIASTSSWARTDVCQQAVDVLHDAIPTHRRPLVFSNGDYNPLNVLADEEGFTGWVDFELGCFEDPLIGFPKFLFWADDRGWSLGSRVGLVERFLHRHQSPPVEFMVRVALRGLTHLLDAPPEQPPARLLGEIEQAIDVLRRPKRRIADANRRQRNL